MVLGEVAMVTPVSETNQWAEIDRMALGLGDCPSYAAPCFCVVVVEDGIHRIAVTKKDRGEYLGHVEAPLFGSRDLCLCGLVLTTSPTKY